MIAEIIVLVGFIFIFFYIVYNMDDGGRIHVPETWDTSFNKVSKNLEDWQEHVFKEEE